MFPRTYETTVGMWRDGAILLVAGPGRPQGRGGVAARRLGVGLGHGRGARAGGVRARGRVARQRSRRGPGRAGAAPTAAATATGNGANGATATARPTAAPVPPAGCWRAACAGPTAGRGRPRRPGPTPPRCAPPSPSRPTRSRRASSPRTARAAGAARRAAAPRGGRLARGAGRPGPVPSRSRPSPGAVLNVRFARGAGPDRVVSAMQAFKALLRERPGRDPGGGPRPGARRVRAADGAARRRLRRGARRRGPPPGRRRASSSSSWDDRRRAGRQPGRVLPARAGDGRAGTDPCRDPVGASILDLGCGPGRIAGPLAALGHPSPGSTTGPR